MRYEVQIKVNGEWLSKGFYETARMAGLRQAAILKAWALFSPNVRVLDHETGQEVEAA